MENSVPVLSMVFMVLDIAAGVALPVGLLIYFRKKDCDTKAFLAGCLVMLIFAFMLEQAVHSIVFATPAGTVIKGNIWLMAIYGGLAAGIFEESGRFFAFRTILRKNQGKDMNALMYGAGHGGFEMFCILSLSMVSNLIYSVMINSGSMTAVTSTLSGNQLAQMNTALSQLSSTAPWMFLVSLLERFAAVISQIAFSVIVWFAAKKGSRVVWLYPLAVILHMLLDASAVIINDRTSNVMFAEIAVYLFTALNVLIALKVWKKNADDHE